MEEYPNNSYAHKKKKQELETKKPKKKVEKAISGNAKTKKKSGFRKLTDIFMPEDVENVKSYILMSVILPEIGRALSDIAHDTIDVVFNGGKENGKSRTPASRISYRAYYEKENKHRNTVNKTRTGYNYDDIVLDSRGEAEEVLSRMDDLMATYEVVSVADLYDLCGITCEYTDNKYGWTNIKNASIIRTREGYMIKMPKAMPID